MKWIKKVTWVCTNNSYVSCKRKEMHLIETQIATVFMSRSDKFKTLKLNSTHEKKNCFFHRTKERRWD